MKDEKKLETLQNALKGKDAESILETALADFGESLVLASSLGAEDQVLTHMLCQLTKTPRIFVLDTGRLHQETYDLLASTEERYSFSYELYFPKTEAVETMVREKGINLFYESIENRRECCYHRKVEPLGRALSSAEAWITGVRREQSPTREDFSVIDWDAAHDAYKLNPLLDWTNEEVWAYIKKHQIPYNSLHDQGFPSIGCAPCTRAIKDGEDLRAGRWWWESKDSKECGLHVVDGKLQRFKDVGDA